MEFFLIKNKIGLSINKPIVEYHFLNFLLIYIFNVTLFQNGIEFRQKSPTIVYAGRKFISFSFAQNFAYSLTFVIGKYRNQFFKSFAVNSACVYP